MESFSGMTMAITTCVVELGCVLGLDGFDDAKVRRYKLNVTKLGKWYIKKQSHVSI
jgi:hypothetical protein